MIVGTAGHVDHGKTSLVKALTGIDADRLKQEKERGITIDLGFAYMPGAAGEVIGFVDVPGHERFVHNMLAGAAGIDFALLVVAADDGVMPQTREHLAIIDLLGIRQGIVAITKTDLVESGRVETVRSEISNILLGTGLEEAEILAVSSATGRGVQELHDRLLEASQRGRAQSPGRAFRLSVDRCFTLQGTGTVVTGTVITGEVVVGDQVLVSPSGLPARVRGLHAQNRPAERGVAGDRCALNLAGDQISKEAISRGDMIVPPALHAPTNRIDAKLRLLGSEPRPLGQWTPVRMHHYASETGARIVLLGDEPIPPAGEALVQLVLERPIAAAVGDRFVLRDTSAQRTMGGGCFLDLRAPARKRRTPERLAQLRAMEITDPARTLAALLRTPPLYVDLGAFVRDRSLTDREAEKLAQECGLVKVRAKEKTVALDRTTWSRLEAAIVATLDRFHLQNPDLAGMSVDRLRMQVEPRLPAPAFASVLRMLVEQGATALDGAWIKLPGHAPRLSERDEASWEIIRPMLGDTERFRPPRVRDIANLLDDRETEVRRLMKSLARMGWVDEIDHDHFFLRETVGEIVAIACELCRQSPDGQFTAAQLRDRLDNGRKVSILILEFLDRHGVTLRRGDLRRMNPHRLDLFRSPVAEPMLGSIDQFGRDAFPVGRPDFKSGRGRETVLGGFDSHSLPPAISRSAR